MVLKKKHSKKLQKSRLKRVEENKKMVPEIDFDTSAYVVYNKLEMSYPCLSFDIIPDYEGSGPERVQKFPLSMYMVAGAQTPPQVEKNYIYVMKADNIKLLKQENEDLDDEEDENDQIDDQSDLPRLTSVKVSHKGCVNRIRVNRIGGRTLTGTWSDKGKVHIYDLTSQVQAVSDQKSINTYTAQKMDPKPVFTFGGHLTEGFAIDWSPLKVGSLATGDCKKNIHIWNMKNQSDWNIDQQPLVGHENSVEDIKWSPDNEAILASCSVDKSIRLWDLRCKTLQRNVIAVPNSHSSDVNVIDWNKTSKSLILSGGDDGVVKVWDVRMMMAGDKDTFPLAQFDYHKKPITSVEWDPNDDTVMAVASDDDKLTLWDLAVEKDVEQEEADVKGMDVDIKKEENVSSESSESEDNDDEDDEDEKADDNEDEEGVNYEDLRQIPEQMLFLHQGQAEIKELHWHPQIPGLIISTALNGINIFKTISA